MGLLNTLGNDQGHLKAGFLGFNASGKTYTAMLLAVGVRRHFKLEGPIAMFDTEGGSPYIAAKVKTLTGKDLVGVRSRSFDDLMTLGPECVGGGVSVLIVDSVTHIWRELCDAYLKDVNEQRKSNNLRPRMKLEFQDWAAVKAIWNDWTDSYLNSPLHIIIAGRAGYEYDFETNEETQRKELIKTGIRMKTEGEFGFEPSLLVEMEREQVPADGRFTLQHRATVLKDRFGVIDGKTSIFDEEDLDKALAQTWGFFKPHIELLIPGAHATIDTRTKSQTGVDEGGDTAWARERRERTIFAEEIQGELVAAWPGQDAKSKGTKAQVLFEVFGTRSWTAVENMTAARLKDGLGQIRVKIHGHPPEEDPPPAEEPGPTLDEQGEVGEQGDLVPALQASVERAQARKGRANGGGK